MTPSQLVTLKREVQAFELHNEEVKNYLQLKEKLEEKETEFKNKVRESRESIETDEVKITFTQAWKKWTDYDVAAKLCTKEELEVLDGITTVIRTVDSRRLVDLCREGSLPDKVRVKAYVEEELTPRISIKYAE